MDGVYPMIDAGKIAEREEATLAPYAMRSAASHGRRYDEPPSGLRTGFQRDRDRILHSTAFRRLEYKTQVFVNHEGDHYRTRLTHTLEVAQISRSMARALGLNEDLVEAIALAHDLGHPPFGHAGEDALNELMGEHGGFNHNLHTLRVIDHLERRYPEFEGLNLSWEIRESTIKHGEFARRAMPEEFEPEWGPLLEAQLADIGDSLAYTTHDIDDGLRSNFITLEEVRGTRLWTEAEKAVRSIYPCFDYKTMVARTVSYLIDSQVRDLIETTRARLLAGSVDSVEKVRSHRGILVALSEEMETKKQEMQQFLHDRLYHHYRTVKMAEKAKRFIKDMFAEFVRNPRQLPPEYERRTRDEGIHRPICDFLAGMTDRYCQEEYQRLFYPFERV